MVLRVLEIVNSLRPKYSRVSTSKLVDSVKAKITDGVKAKITDGVKAKSEKLYERFRNLVSNKKVRSAV